MSVEAPDLAVALDAVQYAHASIVGDPCMLGRVVLWCCNVDKADGAVALVSLLQKVNLLHAQRTAWHE